MDGLGKDPRISVTPPYKMDSSMLARDGASFTSSAVSPYLDSLGKTIMEALSAFEARKVPAEIVLDDNSNETIPQTPAGSGFDTSLTLPEMYKTPTHPVPVEAKSGVINGLCY